MDISTGAGILLNWNGASHAMMVARSLARAVMDE